MQAFILSERSEPNEICGSNTTWRTIIEPGQRLERTPRPRRLNPIKQKQMEDRCVFLEEEVPRIEAAIALTEQQLGFYVSAEETHRLTSLAEELRTQLASLTAEWEDLMLHCSSKEPDRKNSLRDYPSESGQWNLPRLLLTG